MPFKKNAEIEPDIIQSENEESESENEENITVISPPIVENKIEVSHNDLKLKRTKSRIYKTEDGTQVEVKRGRKPKKKPLVVYLSESEEDEQKVIIKPKRGKGRPKAKKVTPTVVYIDADGNESTSRNTAKQTIINHSPENDTEKMSKLSAKDIRLIELEEKLAELSAVSGKKILSTKKGKVDKRQTKPPTEKQLAARAKFVENNKIRLAKNRLLKEEKTKLKSKDTVKEVISELKNIKKQNEIKKDEIKEEIKKEQEIKKPVVSKPLIDDIFN